MWARAAWGRLIDFWDKTARLCLAYLAADCFFAVSAISASYSARSALHSSVCAIPMIAKIVGGNVFPLFRHLGGFGGRHHFGRNCSEILPRVIYCQMSALRISVRWTADRR